MCEGFLFLSFLDELLAGILNVSSLLLRIYRTYLISFVDLVLWDT
jgi:hypothetical protein